MTDTPAPSRMNAKDLIMLVCAIIGAIIAAGGIVAGAIRSDGQREQRLKVVEARTDRLEQRDESRSDLLNKIDVRTARIEATLQMMTKASVQ